MRTTLYISLLFLVLTGCTDSLTGPELEPQRMESFDDGAIADLSLLLDVEISRTDKDSVNVYLTVYNEGPDAATGIRLAFESSTECQIEGAGGDDNLGGGEIILVDIVGSSVADADKPIGGGGDFILVDIVGALATGTGKTLAAGCLASGHESIEFNAEVMASDARDPDSTPGNGNPDEDDETSLRLYPEVPPCPDCPFWIVDDKY